MKSISKTDEAKIKCAIDKAIDRYISTRRQRIPAFVARNFSFKGALALHRKAVGRDLYRSPLNIAWALPYMISRLLSGPLNAVGYHNAAEWLKTLPKGFETDVQKEVKRMVYTDLLELPCMSKECSPGHDALLNEILDQPEIQSMISGNLSQIAEKSLNPEFAKKMEDKILDYTASRTVAEDISGSLILLAVGYVAFRQVSPGPVSTGASVAAAITQQSVVSKFWAGSIAGGWYYGMFPAATTRHVFFLSTASTMAILAVITTFSGIITDPLQGKLGLHRKRLERLVDGLEAELKGKTGKPHRAKEQYMARVFDVMDILRTAAGV